MPVVNYTRDRPTHYGKRISHIDTCISMQFDPRPFCFRIPMRLLHLDPRHIVIFVNDLMLM